MADKVNDIMIVLVLYKTMPNESVTYRCLRRYIDTLSHPYTILIYNNSTENHVETTNKNEFVINASSNGMLATAYNTALKIALEKKIEWVMLLDQDTELSPLFFSMTDAFLSSKDSYEYDMAVPVLRFKDKHLSPFAYNRHIGIFWSGKNINLSHTNFNKIKQSLVKTAFNSASLIRVSAINNIGGFDSDFPLDMLDHRYYFQLWQANSRIYVLDVVMQQNLSLLEENHSMPVHRYKQYLKKSYLLSKKTGFTTMCSFKLFLCYLITNQIRHSNQRQYLSATLKELFAI